MNITNIYKLPDSLVRAVKNDPYVGGGDISVTKLIDAPQRRALYQQYKGAVVEDVSERIWALLGQAVHTVLERSEKTGIAEKRLFTEVDGWQLSGQFDRLDLHDGTLDDYKVTTTYKMGGSVDWERQLNVLRLLAVVNGYTVEKLRVIAIFRDWSRAKAKRDEMYPQRAVAAIDVPVWPLDEAARYVAERIRLHKAAVAGEEVPCTPEERWYEGTKYALIKIGGKRATRVADSRDELGNPQDGYEIQERKGSYKRCEEYCEVAPFCDQWKHDKAESVNE